MRRIAGALAALVTGSVATAMADTPSQWDFNSGDLSASFGPGILSFWDDPNSGVPGGSEAITEFGDTASFGVNPIGGQVADVMRVPPYFGSEGLFVDHFTDPNGGGVYVNQYTLVFDVYITSDAYFFGSGWFPFHNTNCCNANDADAYIQFGVGIGISGEYAGDIQPDNWYRVAFVYDLGAAGPNHWKYIDGALVGSQTLDGLDGRFALYSPNDGDSAPYTGFHLFTEPEGLYTSEAYLNSVYYTDRALSESEVAALGAADADGIGAPGAPACPNNLPGCDNSDIFPAGAPDCIVNLSDLGVVLANFAPGVPGKTRDQGDIFPLAGGDGLIDLSDLGQVLTDFNTNCQ